jgi:lysophospholipase L1-like esterase
MAFNTPIMNVGGVDYHFKDEQTRGYASTLMDEYGDVFWLDGEYYSLTTGELETGISYTGSDIIEGSIFEEQLYGSLSFNDYVSLWANGSYYGYYFRGVYKDGSGNVISDPLYDHWAINKSSSSREYYLINSVSIKEKDLSEIFVWQKGYYTFTDGSVNAGNNYHRSLKKIGSSFEFIDPSIFNANVNNFISFWNQGVYVGYYINNKYYNASQTEVDSLTYTEWAVNMYTSDYKQLNPRSIQSRLERIEDSVFPSRYDHLYGLKIGFLGDSITNGVGASTIAKAYVSLMGNEFGEANVINYGINGSLIASSTSHPSAPPYPMCERYENMSDDLDIVVVFGGTNDWYYGTAWGTVDSSDTDTFLGALNVLMSGLVQKYCGKEIFFVTPMSSAYSAKNTDNPNPDTGKTMLDYRNAIIERATYHAIPVIDLYGMCGMDVAHNAANKTYYSSDGVHPNDAGHKRVHDRIVTFISNILY